MDWERVSSDAIDETVEQFSGLVSAGWARVCELIRVVDVRQSWMADGARNLTDWVAARLRIRHETAVQLVGVARRLADLPVLASKFSSGMLSLDQVDAISRLVTPESEAALVEDLAGLSNAVLDRRARRQRGLSTEEENSVCVRRRLVRQWNLDESELRFRGRLPAAEGRIFDEAIDRRVDEMGTNPETGMFDPYDTRSADALVEMAATDGGGNGAPPQLTVFAELEALTTENRGWAELENTAPISNETARRLGCDAVVEWVITRDGHPIGIGRRSRKIPGWLRRLVRHATAAVGIPDVGTPGGSRSTTSSPGPKADPRIWTISYSYAVSTTGGSTKKAGISPAHPTPECSVAPTGAPTPTHGNHWTHA